MKADTVYMIVEIIFSKTELILFSRFFPMKDSAIFRNTLLKDNILSLKMKKATTKISIKMSRCIRFVDTILTTEL